MRRSTYSIFIVALLCLLSPTPLIGQEIKPHFEEPPALEPKLEKKQIEVQANAEYRLRSIHIDPIALSDESIREIGWTEQRGRLDVKASLIRIAKLNIQLDVLDGVLFGDNGTFLSDPASNSGVSLSAKRPNLTKWKVGVKDGGDPLKPQDYAPQLEAAPLLEINYLYADFVLPIGLLRVGRQPLNYGASISAHDGGRHNRFGVSQYSDGVDRILFATKLNEIYHAIAATEDHEASSSEKEGILFALFYDFMKQDDVATFSDDLRQIGTSLQWKVPEANWFGFEWRNFSLSQSLVHLRNEQFDSAVFGIPFAFESQINALAIKAQYIHIEGNTKEISEGFAALANKPSRRQRITGDGAQLVIDYEVGPVTLTGEFDWASGDSDPRSTTPISTFSFSRDLNVGLLLFEHILAFESARSAGVGIENLAGADVKSFPITEAQTDGRFTNAMAVFPQLDIRWLDTGKHKIGTRIGGLFAWSAATAGVIDPIRTSLAEDGKAINDDTVNYHGGKPGSYYGAEIDFQIRYELADVFYWTVESAVLLPGDALQNEDGQAVRSFLLENRFELVF